MHRARLCAASDLTCTTSATLQAEQRGLSQAKLRLDKHQDIWFFNTHLSAAGTNNGENGPVERAQQVG
jgi:hypothetical protein